MITGQVGETKNWVSRFTFLSNVFMFGVLLFVSSLVFNLFFSSLLIDFMINKVIVTLSTGQDIHYDTYAIGKHVRFIINTNIPSKISADNTGIAQQ